jgi:ketosteroid isomerase-like protein
MDANLTVKQDKEILMSVVEEASKSMTGAQSTKHWANNALWFDIEPFASKGINPARKVFDKAFAQLESIKVDIVEVETFVNGDMGVVCSIQKWNIVLKDGVVNAPIFVRQTDCFEKQDGQWKVIHQHSSVSTPPEWDGKIVIEE